MKHPYLYALAVFIAPTLAIAQSNGSKFEIGGRVMVDHSYFDGVHNEGWKGSEWEIRRARLGIEHRSKSGWGGELELNVSHDDNSLNLSNANLQYRGWDFARLTIGRMKEGFGLENTTSSMNISTMERSVVSEVFTPGRSFGVELSGGGDRHSWNIGIFQTAEDEHGLDSYAATGRFTFNPTAGDHGITHLGLSLSNRDMKGERYEVNEPLEVNVADKVVESRRIAADTERLASLEAAWTYKRFSLQGEWMRQDITEMDVDTGTVNFSGFYVLSSLFLTNDARNYGGGSFGKVRPSGKRGAWELVARYSSIDLMDQELGSSAETMLLGVNYYASGRVRLMANIARAENESSDSHEAGPAKSVTFRAQYGF